MNAHIPPTCTQICPADGKQCVLIDGHKSRHINSVSVEWSRKDDWVPLSQPPLPRIFLDAAALISGPRRESYGPAEQSFEGVAIVWSAILKHEVTASDVAKLMIAFKLMREANAPKSDNRVDCASYLALLDQIENAKVKPQGDWERKAASLGL